jgi:hypothetical protein
MKHFSRQFGVMTHGRCDSGSWHSNDVRFASKWVVLQVDIRNSFNLVSQSAIFQELWFSLDFLH